MYKPIIEIKNLTKDFGQGSSLTHVLRGINLIINQGEFAIIFGPSGSGKSTLLNIINGLETFTTGEVVINSQSVGTLSDENKSIFHQKEIGMVFQAYNLISSLSVVENITLPLVFSKVEDQSRINIAKKYLSDFELSHIANHYPSEISGGQAQRVGIIRALINDPPIIIADEPTGNLDSIAAKKVMELFLDLNKKYKKTLVVVTHDQSLFRYADRIIHVLDGKVIKENIRHSNEKHETQNSLIINMIKESTSVKDKRLLHILNMSLTIQQQQGLSKKEIKQITKLMDNRIKKKMSSQEFYEHLDKPSNKGGLGLYEPTARHIAENFENILKLIK